MFRCLGKIVTYHPERLYHPLGFMFMDEGLSIYAGKVQYPGLRRLLISLGRPGWTKYEPKGAYLDDISGLDVSPVFDFSAVYPGPVSALEVLEDKSLLLTQDETVVS